MKNRSNSTSVPLKTPTEQFISTVTNFSGNFGVNSHNHLLRSCSGDTTPSYSEPSGTSCTIAPLANFLKNYFEYVYYLLVSPFRIEADGRGKFVIKKCRPQMVLCAVMHLLCFIRLMTDVRVNIEKQYSCKNASKNPVQYFNIILSISSLIYKMVTIKRLWFNQAAYLNILNYIQGKHLLRGEQSSIKFFQTVGFLRIFCGLITVHAFTSFIMGKNFVDQSYSWSTSLWSNQLIKMARYTFCFEKNFDITDITPLVTTTSLDIFITILMSISLIQRFIIGLFCDLSLLAHTLTLWVAAKSYSNIIQRNIQTISNRQQDQWDGFLQGGDNYVGNNDNITTAIAYENHDNNGNEEVSDLRWSNVYKRFRVVQKLAMTINTALGSQVTWYMAEGVMYYSVSLNKFLTSMDAFVRVDLAVFYFTTFGILFISADICNQMEHVKAWISFGDNRKTVPSDEFSIVLHEMIAKDIGIRGSNVFTITYSLLAVFFSTIVTYFIICVQQGVDSITILQDTEVNATRC